MKKIAFSITLSFLGIGALLLAGCPSAKNPSSPNPPAPTKTFTPIPSATPTSTTTSTPSSTPTATFANTSTQTPTSTPSSTPTDTASDTPTSSPTGTATTTPTDTPTGTPTPCGTLGTAGDSTLGGGGSTCAAMAAPFTLSKTVYAYQIELYASGQPDNTGVYVGIYSDNSGAPGTLLVSAGPTGLLTGSSWNVIPINSLYLSAGNYWVAAASAGGAGSQWPYGADFSNTTGLFYNGCTSSLPWPTSSSILTGQAAINLIVDYKSCN